MWSKIAQALIAFAVSASVSAISVAAVVGFIHWKTELSVGTSVFVFFFMAGLFQTIWEPFSAAWKAAK